ncbi:MAG: hypothetical protein ACYDIE_02150 [Candidatus Krumholzibacteriia bacterium]
MRRAPAIILCALGLLAAPALSVAPAAATDPAPRWGFGWDPGESGNSGLTLRHRLGRGWEVGLAAGPDDYKEDRESLRWDSNDTTDPYARNELDGYRRESGWVRATGARRFWRDGPFAAAALAGVTYQWSNGQEVGRSQAYTQTSDQDARNWRRNSRYDLWRFTLGLRPSWAPTARLTVEFEAGLAFESWTEKVSEDTWYDFDPTYIRYHQDRPGHAFDSYGVFDWYRLKFIFWF